MRQQQLSFSSVQNSQKTNEKLNIVLRPYQKEALASLPDHGSHVIQLATGLGKTATMANIERRGKLLWLSHREELVTQPIKYFDVPVGIEQGNHHSNGEEIVSASVLSMVNRLYRFKPDEFDVLVVDECHHAAAKTYRKILSYFHPRLTVGITATPVRGDGADLRGVFEDIVYEKNLLDGIKEGYLCDIDCEAIDIGIDLSGLRKRAGDLPENELDRIMNTKKTNKAIAEVYKKHAKGPTLIFAVTVDHARGIAKEIPGAVAVTGETENRAEILSDFQNGKIPCLVTVQVLTEGTDLPCIQTIIMARPTFSESLYIQMTGRGLRLYPGKEKLHLLDLTSNYEMGLCSPATLIGEDISIVPPKKRKKALSGDLTTLGERTYKLADCPRTWIKGTEKVDIFAASRQYDTHRINFIPTPDGSWNVYLPEGKITLPPIDATDHVVLQGRKMRGQQAIDIIYNTLEKKHKDSRNLWDLDLMSGWGAQPASVKQVRYMNYLMRQVGFQKKDIAGIEMTKGVASTMITNLKRKMEEEEQETLRKNS